MKRAYLQSSIKEIGGHGLFLEAPESWASCRTSSPISRVTTGISLCWAKVLFCIWPNYFYPRLLLTESTFFPLPPLNPLTGTHSPGSLLS